MSSTLPITFSAFANTELKSPLVPLERTVSSLQADELLVKVAYASVNPMDGKLQQFNKFNLPLPFVLGFDFSGTVVAVGERGGAQADASITIGSPVFGFSFKGQCYAEYVVADRAHVASRKDVPEAEASSYGVAYLSAWEPLETVGRVSQRAGQWIYVAGAGGGVGHFATQIAKAAGLKVIGSASKPESIELLRSLGVDHVIDYSKQDVVEEVLVVTGGKGADVVFDSTYRAESMRQSAACVASGGLWLRLGAQDDLSLEACKVAEERGATATYGDLGRYMYAPDYMSRVGVLRQALEDAVGLYREGKIKPHISAVIPFDAQALQQAITDNLNGKRSVGKTIVKVLVFVPDCKKMLEKQRAPKEMKAEKETDKLPARDAICESGAPSPRVDERATAEDEAFLLWATSEEVRKRSLDIYEEMRTAETVWEISCSGKMVRVANPLLEMTNAEDSGTLSL